MPNSQFNSPATLDAAGSAHVTGSLAADGLEQDVEFRFMIVQGDAVVEGTGQGSGAGWSGTTRPGQDQLAAGPALAIGLAILARKAPGRGYETFTWSEQIDLKP